jgi:hypothetical protein
MSPRTNAIIGEITRSLLPDTPYTSERVKLIQKDGREELGTGRRLAL